MEAKPEPKARRYTAKYIVHDERRFVYFVIQKVACTSIKTALLPLFDLNTAAYERPRADGGTIMAHSIFDDSDHQIDRAELLAGLGTKYSGYFKFVFVRNPWDRLVSCYANKFVDRRKGLGDRANAGVYSVPICPSRSSSRRCTRRRMRNPTPTSNRSTRSRATRKAG